jgi:hypothetical protein
MVGELIRQAKEELGNRMTHSQWQPGHLVQGAMQQVIAQYMFKGISNFISSFKRK